MTETVSAEVTDAVSKKTAEETVGEEATEETMPEETEKVVVKEVHPLIRNMVPANEVMQINITSGTVVSIKSIAGLSANT